MLLQREAGRGFGVGIFSWDGIANGLAPGSALEAAVSTKAEYLVIRKQPGTYLFGLDARVGCPGWLARGSSLHYVAKLVMR